MSTPDIQVSKFIELANEHSRPDCKIEFYVRHNDKVYYAELGRIGAFGVIPDLTVTVELPSELLADLETLPNTPGSNLATPNDVKEL